jgi:hypothetical protein
VRTTESRITILCVNDSPDNPVIRTVHATGGDYEIEESLIDATVVAFTVRLKSVDGRSYIIGSGTEIVPKGYKLGKSQCWPGSDWKNASEIMLDEHAGWCTKKGLRGLVGSGFLVGLFTPILSLSILLLIGIADDWVRFMYILVGAPIGWAYERHIMRRAGVNPEGVRMRIRRTSFWL